MEVRIQAIHFDATEKLQDFIQKKTAKLEKYCDDINKVEVSLKVVKPETAMNKEASIKVLVPNGEFFAEKVSDTFEESVEYQSGQMGQTVNLLSFDFGGSNPSLPTFLRLERSLVFCGSSSVDRALAFQAEGRGFEPRLPLFFFCCYSSVVEHFLGKEEVQNCVLSILSTTLLKKKKEVLLSILLT